MARPWLDIRLDTAAAVEGLHRDAVLAEQTGAIGATEDQILLGGQEQHGALEVRGGGGHGRGGQELADREGVLGRLGAGEDRGVEVWVREERVLVRGAVGPGHEARAVLFRGEAGGRVGGREVEAAGRDEEELVLVDPREAREHHPVAEGGCHARESQAQRAAPGVSDVDHFPGHGHLGDVSCSCEDGQRGEGGEFDGRLDVFVRVGDRGGLDAQPVP